MAQFRLTVRVGSSVDRARFGSLGEALAALEARVEEMARGERRESVSGMGRSYEPVAQVAARLEVSGPGAHGGVDVRGDGSAEAFTGRWQRRVVERGAGETALGALRRALGG